MIDKILQLEDNEIEALLHHIFKEFSSRYRNIQAIFPKHFNLIKHLLGNEAADALPEETKLLIGSYFTMESSIEAAALFNPSIVEDPI